MIKKQFQLPITDSRDKPEPAQQFALAEQLKSDKTVEVLTTAHRLLGSYSAVTPKDITVKIVDGVVGEGTARGTVVEIQMPNTERGIEQLEGQLGSLLEAVPQADRREKCQEILLSLISSTILHEGLHTLINSRPESKLATDFERISGLENTQGVISTLLDEGLTYAIQGIYAGEVEPLGNLTPRVRDSDNPDLRRRKILGEKLRPKVKEYLDEKRTLDNEFLTFASGELKDIL